MKRFMLGCLLFCAGIGAGVAGSAVAADRQREKSNPTAVGKEYCFKAIDAVPDHTDAGFGGALKAHTPAAGWRLRFKAEFFPAGNPAFPAGHAAAAEEDILDCGGGRVLANGDAAAFSMFLNDRNIGAILRQECKTPAP